MRSDDKNLKNKIEHIFLFISLTSVLGTHKNCLIEAETVLLSTHHICFA